MACNRRDYLERTVESILKYHSPVASKFPLFISQDGTNQAVKDKALSYNQITYMQHLDFEPVHPERPGEILAYYKIARHYKWALDALFNKHNFNRVIILEDDMEIAPDFFDYFEATASILDKDETIMAVSSWNDNGQVQFVHDSKTLYRSDFFPDLGWMLTKSIWNELSPKWPKAYWDDWLRLKEVHQDRQFIRPEICRTYNFGEHIDWKSMDLSYLMEVTLMLLPLYAYMLPLSQTEVIRQGNDITIVGWGAQPQILEQACDAATKVGGQNQKISTIVCLTPHLCSGK